MSALDAFHCQLADILPNIELRLQTVTGLTPQAVFFWQGDDDPPYHALAERYIWLRLEDQGADQPIIQGSGRYDARETQILRVVPRVRVSLDMADRHDIGLIHPQYGILPFMHQMYDALLGYQPVNSSNQWLVVEPMRVLRTSRPHQIPRQPEWLESTMYFSLTYELNLSVGLTGIDL